MDYTDSETKNMLYQLYWNEKMSFRAISKELGIPQTNIKEMFVKYGIRSRTKHQSMKNHWLTRPRKVYE